MDTTISQYSNPWLDDDRSVGSLRNALILAEKTGHLRRSHHEAEVAEDLPSPSTNIRISSLEMISLLKDIQATKSEIHEIHLAIQERLQDKETKDLTHAEILEKRISQINSLNAHLQHVVANKDQLIARLQQPFVGEFLRVDASHHKYLNELFPKLVPILADLSSLMDNIDWASKVDMTSEEHLESLLSDISTCLASIQTSVQSCSQLRQTMYQVNQR